MSNMWVICFVFWDKFGKLGLILDRIMGCMFCGGKCFSGVG